ncbi:hypothetical protein Hokovirus_2_240 [Hokovirus HKV1]|uniref:Uncharacterized protein n=1 Tax=Hokovirus HKV1 TaxID=1977638 RepID=A0A1V0SG81_9VIRU|nr:hypothetical protein Hokovirus_2_240 [Hokovirus HKV1]
MEAITSKLPKKIPFTQISITSVDIFLSIYYLIQGLGIISIILGVIYLLIFNQIVSGLYYRAYDTVTGTNRGGNANNTNNANNANNTNNANNANNANNSHKKTEKKTSNVYGPDSLLKFNIVVNMIYALYFLTFGILLFMADVKFQNLMDNVDKCYINRNKYN